MYPELILVARSLSADNRDIARKVRKIVNKKKNPKKQLEEICTHLEPYLMMFCLIG